MPVYSLSGLGGSGGGKKKKDEKKKGKGGIFGSGINLGVGSFLSEIKAVPGGLVHLGASLAPGGANARDAWSQFGTGILKSMAQTGLSVAPGAAQATKLLGVDDDLRKRGIEPDMVKRLQNRGVVSTLVEDIGNASILGGAATKLTKVAQVNKANTAARLASTGNAAGAAKAAAAAERLGRISSTASKVASPYRSVGREVISPLSREFAGRLGKTGAITRRLADEAAPSPATPDLDPIDDFFVDAKGRVTSDAAPAARPSTRQPTNLDIGAFEGLTGSADAARIAAEAPRTAVDELAAVGARRTRVAGDAAVAGVLDESPKPRGADQGPAERAARARHEAPISGRVQKAADVLGKVPGVGRALASVETGRFGIQTGEFNRIAREQSILADASRRAALSSPEVQQMVAAARDQIIAKHPQLDDGTPMTERMADEMFADAVRARASGVESVVDEARARGVKDDVLRRRGIIGQNSLPLEWLDDADLDAAVSQAVEGMSRISAEQTRILSGGRAGTKGLEAIGSESPVLTRADRTRLRKAEREINRAEHARKRTPKEQAQAEARVGRQADAVARNAQKIQDLQRRRADATREFHNTRAPAVMRDATRWAAARRAIVQAVQENGGATFGVHAGALIVPAAYGGDAVGHAVSVLDLLDEPMLADEFFRITDPETGATVGDGLIDQLAREMQDAFGMPGGTDLNIGVWVDEGKVYVDLSQYTKNGTPITRDQAMLMGAARNQLSIMDFESGAFLDTTEATGGLRPDIAAELLNTGSRYHDRQANAYRSLLKRERELAASEGRAPKFDDEYIDALMEADRRVAAFLKETQPERFKTLDDAFRAMKTQLGKDPKRLPEGALLQMLPALQPGDAGIQWWDRAKERFPNWEELAAWYDRSHEGIERDFRGQTIKLLDGSERDMADVMYDLVALASVQATPFEDLRYSLNAVGNLKKTMADIESGALDARALMEEFQASGVTGPMFRRLAGDYLTPALDELRPEFEARGEILAYGAEGKNAIQKQLIDAGMDPKSAADEVKRIAKEHGQIVNERRDALMTSDPTGARVTVHRNRREQNPLLVILTGRSLDTWDAAFMNEVLPDIMGQKAKGIAVEYPQPKTNKAGQVVIDKTTGLQAMTDGNATYKHIAARAEATGLSVEDYIVQRGTARVAAMQSEAIGSAGREAATKFSPEDVRRLGEEWAVREAVGESAHAKLRSFRENLASPGASDATTLDQWMGRLFEGRYSGASSPGEIAGAYAIWADELRVGAQRLREQGVTVDGHPVRGHHLQALLWAYAMDEGTRLAYIAKQKDPDGRPLPPAQDFAHILDDPSNPHRQMLDDIAADEGFDSFGDMVLQSFTETLDTHPAFQGVLYQKVSGDVRGATWVNAAGEVTMRYFETADARTLLHERGHGLRLLLGDAEATNLGRAYGGDKWDGNWTEAMEEAFTEDWTRISEGRTPGHANVGPMLQRLHNFVTQLWEITRDLLAGHRIPDAAHELFDRVHNPERLNATSDPVISASELGTAVSRGEAVAGQRLAQVARSAPGARKANVSEAYQAGRSGQAALDKARKLEDQIAKREALQSRREEILTKARQALLDEELPSEVRAAVAEGNAAKLADAVAKHQENPSLTGTPAHLQPLWHAYTSLVDEALQAGDEPMAQMLLEIGPELGRVLEFAKAQGFDPQYIPKMQPQQVRSVVYETMRLGRNKQLGFEVEAGARKERSYVQPELMDRSIGGLVGGMLDAVHESHTNALVNYIEESVARPIPDGRLPEGWVIWDDSKQWIMTGEDTAGVRVGAGGKLMIPKAMDDTLRSYGKDYNHWVFNGLRKVTNPWRAMVLPLRPAWYVNNIVGNAILASASGVGLKDWHQAWKQYRGGKLATHGRLQSTFEEPGIAGGLAEDLIHVDETSLIPTTARSALNQKGKLMGAPKAASLGIQHLGRANTVVDHMARVAAHISAKRKGMSDTDALVFAQQALVDYGDLTPMERAYIRAAVPFYAWQKGILKLSARHAIDHPAVVGIMLQIGELNKELQQDRYGTELPGAYTNMVETPVGNINLTPLNPFGDAGSLLTPQGIAGSLNPFVELGARDALAAPEFGFAAGHRLSPIGTAEPTQNTAGELRDMLAFAPQAQMVRGATGDGAGEARFAGIPAFTDEEFEKIIARTKKGRAKVAGQSMAEAGLSDAKPKAPAMSEAQKKLRRQLRGSLPERPRLSSLG